MQHTTLDDERQQRHPTGKAYHEFLRQPSMSAGLYELAAGASDEQQPYTEDELYYIVSGRAFLSVGDADFAVTMGALVFVPAGAVHRFHAIREDLSVLVFFAPAEYPQGSPKGAR